MEDERRSALKSKWIERTSIFIPLTFVIFKVSTERGKGEDKKEKRSG